MPSPKDDTARDLHVLVGVAHRLAETFELAPLLKTIEEASLAALGCDRATVFLYDATAEELYSKVATGVESIRIPLSRGIAGEAARTRSIIHVPDAYADARFNREVDRATGYRTRNLLTVPLVTPDGDLMGVLQVLNKLSGDFTAHDEMIAGALGALTGTALKRQMLLDEAAVKQRLERDLNIARSIQQQLLPARAPEVPGFDVAGWNRPADQTGGDCYDFRALDASRVAVMIADATGHGIGPALIVAQCRSLLRALADGGDRLAEVAGRVNALLYEDLPDDRFVTTCFGVLDATAARFAYVSAGHGPLFVVRATGEVESRPATGLPMGVIPQTDIEQPEEVDFGPGDLFVLMTDGFTEWHGPDGGQYGEQRLIDMIIRHRDRPCAEIIETLYHDVLQFGRGSPQLDDLTAVLIKRTG